jgi:hypothetical protein
VSGPAPRQLFICSEWPTALHGLKLVIFSLCAVVLFAKGLGGSLSAAGPDLTAADVTSAQQDRA